MSGSIVSVRRVMAVMVVASLHLLEMVSMVETQGGTIQQAGFHYAFVKQQ